MKKSISLIFSRFVIISFLIIFQISTLLFVVIRLSEYFVYVYFFFLALSVVTILFIINKDERPDFKIPWLFILLLFPLIGGFLYLMFNPRLASYKMSKRAISVREKLLTAYKGVTKTPNISKFTNINQSKYIKKVCQIESYTASNCTYYPIGQSIGKSFVGDLFNDLTLAKQFIFLEFFIIEDGFFLKEILKILIEKAKQGVDVRILYDDIGSLNKISAKTMKEIKSSTIKMVPFNRFTFIFSAVYNNRDHRKIIVIDGLIAYTGSMNITDDCLNIRQKYGYWKDVVLRMTGAVANSFTLMFFENYLTSTKEDEDVTKFFNSTALEEENKLLIQPFYDGPRPSDDEYIAETIFLNMINQATDYVYIMTPYFIVDYAMNNAIKMAVKRGVKVVIITPHIPDKKIIFMMTRSYYMTLIEAGVTIYEYTPGFIHAKTIISDDNYAVVGTINFDFRSLCHHFECGVWLEGKQIVDEIKKDFQKTIDVAELITLKKARQLNRRFRLVVTVLKIFAPLL